MVVVSAREAAEALNVSVRQVELYVKSGRLAAVQNVGPALAIDSASVNRLNHARGRGRVWKESTACAALTLLSGENPGWVDSHLKSRIRARLRIMDWEQLSYMAGGRAVVRRLWVVESRRRSVQDQLLASGRSALADEATAAGFGLSGGEGPGAEGYTDQRSAGRMIAANRMRDDPQGNVVLRISDVAATMFTRVPMAAIALDLAESPSTREHSAARSFLIGALNA